MDSLLTESPRKPFHCVDHNKLWKILKEMGGTFLVVQWLDSMLPIQGAWVQSLVRELDPMEEEIATHSSILSWRIPWTEEPGRLQFMGLQRVRHD